MASDGIDEDFMDFAAARVKMVDNQIRTTDVTDNTLLRAFLNVPREPFAPPSRRELAYIGGEIPLAPGRALMEASPLAKLIQMAEVRQGDRVLDVGCGTGYSSAILAYLGAEVTALEENGDLIGQARIALDAAGATRVTLVEGALREGHKGNAPYDVILFEGAVDEVPDAFITQLAERGRLVVVVGRGNAGMAKLYVRDGDVVSDRFGFNCSLRTLPGFEQTPAFTF